MSSILAIDTGPVTSGWCLFEGRRVIDSGSELLNQKVLELVKVGAAGTLALEMIGHYGMPVGREVFETVLWVGRYVQAWRDPDGARLVYRSDVKSFLCGSAKAKDPHIRQALIDLLGPVGVKANPGPLYRVSGHAWAAVAVAATVARVQPIRGSIGGVSEEQVAGAI